MAGKLTIPTRDCKRCGHHWRIRFPREPKVCPECKSPYWDSDYVRGNMVKKGKGK